ncbi:hypothetical protein N7516_000193 [Penicillium verrucosum]|uniref:uncharacterized protein n=1 Tax=Penicillium verrucosum TaxID=60171 RepID=UPI002544DC87|nr:uncharacterized protein N7516_000193 [Penicillium verrucosum]KAJ5940025.1 hypothetical protein N7516_000193 [Penicillium verrucosum]
MLSWQLASDDGSQPQSDRHTLWIYPFAAASWLHPGPKNLSNQLLKPPCSFASRSVLPLKSPPPSLVPILSDINLGSPCLNCTEAPAPYTRLPLTGDKSLRVTLPSVLDSEKPTAYISLIVWGLAG